MKKHLFQTVVEMGFIIFLFYSNLLMGLFTRTGMGNKKGLGWAIEDIFTIPNFTIALVSSFIAHIVFNYLRKKY